MEHLFAQVLNRRKCGASGMRRSFYAYHEAVMLGLATEQVVGVERCSLTVRKTLKDDASVEPTELERFGFHLRSTLDFQNRESMNINQPLS
jgi:hypothetical protein